MSDVLATAQRTRKRSRLRRGALATALVLVSLPLAELAARGLLWALGRSYSAAVCKAELCTSIDALGSFLSRPGGDHPGLTAAEEQIVLQPYVGWDRVADEDIVAADAEHYQSAAAQATYDVLVLGGSVAQTFAVKGEQRLRARLAADARFSARRIRIFNHGRAAYKAPQQVILLCYLLSLGHEPDLVLEVDGFNEVALGWTNVQENANPVYPSLGMWAALANDLRSDGELVDLLHALRSGRLEAQRFAQWAFDHDLWQSCILGEAAIARTRALRARNFEAYQRLFVYLSGRQSVTESRGPPLDRRVEPAFDLIVRIWEQNSRMIAAICAGRSISYLHVLQPTLHDAGSKPLTATEIAHSGAPPTWIEGVHVGYPLLRQAAERLRGDGVPFLDASQLFRDVREDLYSDGCHFVERGHHLLADAIADALLGLHESAR